MEAKDDANLFSTSLRIFLQEQLEGNEIYIAWFEGEVSDFVRFNQAKVRQPGTVHQYVLSVTLIDGARHASVVVNLSRDQSVDRALLRQEILHLREELRDVPEDPYLLYSTEPHSTEDTSKGILPDAMDATNGICKRAKGYDFVGIYASGDIYRGFANSLGQRNWFSRQSFNLDWSLYHQADKAVKAEYAGFRWSEEGFSQRFERSCAELAVLKVPPRTIPPGTYRAYLSPAAMCEVLQLLSWGDFGTKAHRTKTTALLRLAEESECLNPMVSITEDTQHGAGPAFGGEGFLRPDAVPLIAEGRLANTLCSPRSAKEYGVQTNGSDHESTRSSEYDAGLAFP